MCTFLPSTFAQGAAPDNMVRRVYLLPSNRAARPERIVALRQLIKDAMVEHTRYSPVLFLRACKCMAHIAGYFVVASDFDRHLLSCIHNTSEAVVPLTNVTSPAE